MSGVPQARRRSDVHTIQAPTAAINPPLTVDAKAIFTVGASF
jgi:hypothetical protein